MATHIRKNVVIPAELDLRIRRLAAERGSSQSGLLVHLVHLGLAAEMSGDDPLLKYLGVIDGPPDLSRTVDETLAAS